MKTEATNRARILHQQIRDVLLQEWDPIGVGTMPGAQDEYDSYVPAVYSMLIARKPVAEIFEYLLWLETEHMGLAADRQETQNIAERLFSMNS